MEFDIDRRRTFNDAAAQYDKYRPTYPERLVDDVVALSGLDPDCAILEVGSGTGKATIPFAKRNYRVDCVEPGQNLASTAMKNCAPWPKVRIYVSDFEGFSCLPAAYDLVFSAQAYHWIDPACRMRLAARALKHSGSFALIYNYSPVPTDPVFQELSSAISRAAGKRMDGTWDYDQDIRRWTQEITECGYFRGLTVRHYPWDMAFSAEEYAGLFRTFSDFLSLEQQTQKKLLTVIEGIVNENGGTILKPYDGLLFHARNGEGA